MAVNPKRDSINRLAKVGPIAVARSQEVQPKADSRENADSKAATSSKDSAGDRLLLSIGEAAARLGTDKARLRIVLSHGQVSHKLVVKRPGPNAAEAGQDAATAAGPSQPERGKGVRVPVEILDDLRLLLENLPNDGGVDTAVSASFPVSSALPMTLVDEADRLSETGTEVSKVRQAADGDATDAFYDAARNNAESLSAAQVPLLEQGTSDAQRSVATATSMPLSLAFERLMAEKEARIEDLKAEITHLRDTLEREQLSHSRTQTLLSLLNQAPTQVAGAIDMPSIETPPDNTAAASTPLIASAEAQSNTPQSYSQPQRGLLGWVRSRWDELSYLD